MNNKLKFFCLTLFVLLLSGNLIYAQESMFQDLTYPYLEKLIAGVAKGKLPKG